MSSASPLARLSRRLNQTRRHGVVGALQRVTLAILPAPPPSSPVESQPEIPADADPDLSDIARERARRALVEARRTMSGIIGEEPSMSVELDNVPDSGALPDFERLQSYLEESERQQTAMREVIADLREVVRSLQSRLDGLERLLPAGMPAHNGPEPETAEAKATDAPPAALESPETSPHAEGERPVAPDVADAANGAVDDAAKDQSHSDDPTSPPAMIQETEDPEQLESEEVRVHATRALHERVFAAGTVGTCVQITPAPSDKELDAILARLNGDPLVEHATARDLDGEEAPIRITLRAPLRWEQFSPVVERALDQPIDQCDVIWAQGAVRVHLSRSAAQSHGPADNVPDAEAGPVMSHVDPA